MPAFPIAGTPVALSGGGYVIAGICQLGGFDTFVFAQAYDADGNAVGSLFEVHAANGVHDVARRGDRGRIRCGLARGQRRPRTSGRSRCRSSTRRETRSARRSTCSRALDLNGTPTILKLADGNLAVVDRRAGRRRGGADHRAGRRSGRRDVHAGGPTDRRRQRDRHHRRRSRRLLPALAGRRGRRNAALGPAPCRRRHPDRPGDRRRRRRCRRGLSASLVMSADGSLVVSWTEYDGRPQRCQCPCPRLRAGRHADRAGVRLHRLLLRRPCSARRPCAPSPSPMASWWRGSGTSSRFGMDAAGGVGGGTRAIAAVGVRCERPCRQRRDPRLHRPVADRARRRTASSRVVALDDGGFAIAAQPVCRRRRSGHERRPAHLRQVRQPHRQRDADQRVDRRIPGEPFRRVACRRPPGRHLERRAAIPKPTSEARSSTWSTSFNARRTRVRSRIPLAVDIVQSVGSRQRGPDRHRGPARGRGPHPAPGHDRDVRPGIGTVDACRDDPGHLQPHPRPAAVLLGRRHHARHGLRPRRRGHGKRSPARPSQSGSASPPTRR